MGQAAGLERAQEGISEDHLVQQAIGRKARHNARYAIEMTYMNKAEEFKLFIQSIGFVYNMSTINKEYFILDQYEICISYGLSYSMSTYALTEKVQMGVTRTIAVNGISHHREDLDVFRTILREKKLKDLGI